MTHSSLHTHAHAIQAIDATLAALEILENLGYDMTSALPLYNVGVSEGGEVSYEVQKQIENDITSAQRNSLNLKLTFSANGALDHVQYIEDKVGRVRYSGDQDQFEVDMEILKNAFECLPEEDRQGYDPAIFYSQKILSSDGVTLNANHPVFLILKIAMLENTIRYNWNPGHPLTLAGSYDDTTIKFENHGAAAYEKITNHPDGTINNNVRLDGFRTPVVSIISGLVDERLMVAHIVADMVCFIHAVRYENPNENDIIGAIL